MLDLNVNDTNLVSLKLFYIRVHTPRAFKTSTYMLGYRGATIYLRKEALQLLHFKLYQFIRGLKVGQVRICCFVGTKSYARIARWVAGRLQGSLVLRTYRRGPWLFFIKGVCYPLENPYLLNSILQFFEPGAVVLFDYPADPVLSYLVQAGAPIIDLSTPSKITQAWSKLVAYQLYQNDRRVLLFYARLLVSFFNDTY